MGHSFRVESGKSAPLGACYDGSGVNFSLVAPNAQAVTLCFFDDQGIREEARLTMTVSQDGVWSCYVPDAQPGQVYGYRVSGEYAPEKGLRFNDRKVLLDPYAREVVGRYEGQDEFSDESDADTGAMALKGRVVNEQYDWGDDRRPRTPAGRTILYELHVKGFTKLHPQVPEAIRGTYAALAEPAVLDYLEKLGITAVELLPVFAMADEKHLSSRGLVNYWGYSTIGFFAPDSRYWSRRPGTTPISEFRDMVKALHSRKIEVILDVVYNHTAEGNEQGAMLSFKGIDNAMYYHLRQENPAQYENWSGCGNSLNLGHPVVQEMVLDSLRYWATEMHVDGFRFDLAPSLARENQEFSRRAGFFMAISKDPVLSRVKLIAEPWDLGPDGYQLGNFPFGWMEWNDRFRNTMRSFWLQQGTSLAEFARRATGSHDVFGSGERLPSASINFITAHDGFTLQDLVSYIYKHNEANGEDNRDGTDYNLSCNCGFEGPTDLKEIIARRKKLVRALLSVLMMSQGTPMLLAGDEFGHSQGGNNNPYCQDNETTWLDWGRANRELISFVSALIAKRKESPVLGRNSWHATEPSDSVRQDEGIRWLSPNGADHIGKQWTNQQLFCVGALLRSTEASGSSLLLINASQQQVVFRLPNGRWKVVMDSSCTNDNGKALEFQVILPSHSVILADA